MGLTKNKAFWAQVDKQSADTGCWLWTGKLNMQGYGVAKYRGREEAAYRVAWRLTNPGQHLKDRIVGLTCKDRRCVNPAHLYVKAKRVSTPPSQPPIKAMLQKSLGMKVDPIAPARVIPVDNVQRRKATDKAFRERDALVVALSKLLPAHLMRTPGCDPSFAVDWQWIVCIHAPSGQMAWRIHDDQLIRYAHLDRSDDNHWDGHNTQEKYARLARLKPTK